MRYFGESVHTGEIRLDETLMDQSNLLKEFKEFSDKSSPRKTEGKNKKRNTFESVNALYEDRELTINAFKSGIFPRKINK